VRSGRHSAQQIISAHQRQRRQQQEKA